MTFSVSHLNFSAQVTKSLNIIWTGRYKIMELLPFCRKWHRHFALHFKKSASIFVA